MPLSKALADCAIMVHRNQIARSALTVGGEQVAGRGGYSVTVSAHFADRRA